MPILSGLIGKILLMVEGILENWVSVSSVTIANDTALQQANCYTSYALTVSREDCFSPFVTTIGDIVEGVVDLVPILLTGLFASE